MANSIISLIVGLLIGVYLTASYPAVVITGFQKVHVPLLAAAHTASANEVMH